MYRKATSGSRYRWRIFHKNLCDMARNNRSAWVAVFPPLPALFVDSEDINQVWERLTVSLSKAQFSLCRSTCLFPGSLRWTQMFLLQTEPGRGVCGSPLRRMCAGLIHSAHVSRTIRGRGVRMHMFQMTEKKKKKSSAPVTHTHTHSLALLFNTSHSCRVTRVRGQ